MQLDRLRILGKDLDISDFDQVYHGAELLLAHNLLTWLDSQVENGWQGQLKQYPDLLEFCHKVVIRIQEADLEDFDLDLTFDHPERDFYGGFLQDLLEFEERKQLASNYTENCVWLMDNLPVQYSSDVTKICDHFCGSGNLVVAYLYHLRNQGYDHKVMVKVNDLMPTAVLLTVCRLLALDANLEIEATVGDGFEVSGTFNLVLINPPYTRSHRISQTTKMALASLRETFEDYSTGQAGLHFWAVLDVVQKLGSSGQAVFVLPRASLNASYSQAMKAILMDHFDQLDFYQYHSKKAFSQGSDLRELLLVAGSGRPHLGFHKLLDQGRVVIQSRPTVDQLQQSWNWGMYFLEQSYLDYAASLRDQFHLRTGQELKISLTRGIELYGPRVFFYPNPDWSLTLEDSQVILSGKNREFHLDREDFRPILRKPNLYKQYITPHINHYVMALAPQPNDAARSFLKFRYKDARSARNRFGEDWHWHTTKQIDTKDPRGRIFIIDKLDIAATPTLAYFTDVPTLCTKNFYILQTKYSEELLAAWLNSTIYLFLYLVHRREIGGTYGRLQIVDYSHHRLFPDLSILVNEQTVSGFDSVSKAFQRLRTSDIGLLPDQLHHPLKIELDRALLEFFDISLNVYRLHEITASLLESIVI